jgi:hypothetical protein
MTTTTRRLLALVVLGTVVACSSTPTTGNTTAANVEQATTTTQPAYMVYVEKCQAAASPQLAEQVSHGGTLLASILRDCTVAAEGLAVLRDLAGPRINDLHDAVVTFITALSDAQINLKDGQYNAASQDALGVSVKDFQAAVARYLKG